MTTRAFLLASLGLLVALGPLGASPGAFSLSVHPEEPEPGSPFAVELIIKDLSALSLDRLDPSPGLELGASLAKPYVSPDGLVTGSLLRLEFNVTGQGPWAINRLVVSGKEGALSLGPFHFEAKASPSPGGARAAPKPWVWLGPDQVYRYAAFGLALAPGSGEVPKAKGSLSSFVPPGGASFEALPGTSLEWTVTALEAGHLDLPEVKVESGSLSGKAPKRRIEVLPLPPSIAGSRAMGSFELSLDPPPQTLIREGDPLLFRLVLEGRGNLPSVLLPGPVLSLGGRPLGKDTYTTRRRDEVRVVQGGYEGRVILELSLPAPVQGIFSVSFPPLPVLLPDGSLASLSVEAFQARVLKAAPRKDGLGDPFLQRLPGLAKALAAASPGLAKLPALLGASRYKAARELLAKAPAKIQASPEAKALEASLLWVEGHRGEALAAVYAQSRSRRDPGPDLLALAKEAPRYLGTNSPASKSLPRASLVAWLSGLALVGGLGLGLASRWLRGSSAAKHLYKGFALLLALAGLGLGFLAGASALEDRIEYAVVWTDTLVAVPSSLAEGRVIVVRGSSARVMGRTEGYVGLKLEDGSVGWAPQDLVFSY